MNESPTKEPGPLRRWWRRFVKGWVGEFDEEMAACELNCRELDCDLARWETCENRLQYMAAIREHRRKVAEGTSFRDALNCRERDLPANETQATKQGK